MKRKYDLVSNMYIDMRERQDKYQSHITHLKAQAYSINTKQPDPPSRLITRKNRYIEIQKRLFKQGEQNMKIINKISIKRSASQKSPQIIKPLPSSNRVDWLKTIPGGYNLPLPSFENTEKIPACDRNKTFITSDDGSTTKRGLFKPLSKPKNTDPEDNVIPISDNKPISKNKNEEKPSVIKPKPTTTISKPPKKEGGELENQINEVSNKLFDVQDDNNKKQEETLDNFDQNDIEDDFEKDDNEDNAQKNESNKDENKQEDILDDFEQEEKETKDDIDNAKEELKDDFEPEQNENNEIDSQQQNENNENDSQQQNEIEQKKEDEITNNDKFEVNDEMPDFEQNDELADPFD